MAISDTIMDQLLQLINNADPTAAAENVAALRQRHPNDTADQITARLIRNKCLQTGSVGAVTSGAAIIPGIGQVASMTFGVAADITLTYQYQAELVLEIAAAYDHILTESEKRRVILLISGLGQGSQKALQGVGTTVAQKASEELAKRSLAKAIPFLGVAISGGINITSTYVIGRRAQAYFARGPEELDDWGENMRALTGIDEREIADWLGETTTNSWELIQSGASTTSNAIIVSGQNTKKAIIWGSSTTAGAITSTAQQIGSGISNATQSITQLASSGLNVFRRNPDDSEETETDIIVPDSKEPDQDKDDQGYISRLFTRDKSQNDVQSRLEQIDDFVEPETKSEESNLPKPATANDNEPATDENHQGRMRWLFTHDTTENDVQLRLKQIDEFVLPETIKTENETVIGFIGGEDLEIESNFPR